MGEKTKNTADLTTLPFTLNPIGDRKKADQPLIVYLKNHGPDFLRNGTRDTISSSLNEAASLHEHRRGHHDDTNSPQCSTSQKNTGNTTKSDDLLLRLWDDVLQDALLALKKKDTREWDPKGDDEKQETFFHRKSLGIDTLSDLFREGFANMEGLLYGASPDRYRDHIAHVFRVWIVGDAILMNEQHGMNQQLRIDGDFGKTPKWSVSTEEWRAMWAITALCHDIGYPLEAVSWVNRRARNAFEAMGFTHGGDLKFHFPSVGDQLTDTILRILSSKLVYDSDNTNYLTHVQNKYYMKYSKSLCNARHGIVSSILLARSVLYFLESDLCHDTSKPLNEKDARQFLIRRDILRSIASHTCQDVYHLRFNTLSFLLFIVDEIQCWGRPTLEELQHRAHSVQSAEAHISKITGTELDIEFRSADKHWDSDKHADAKRELDKLHCMLRLAVDTKDMWDLSVSYRVRPNDDKEKGHCLLLKDERIDIVP